MTKNAAISMRGSLEQGGGGAKERMLVERKEEGRRWGIELLKGTIKEERGEGKENRKRGGGMREQRI